LSGEKVIERLGHFQITSDGSPSSLTAQGFIVAVLYCFLNQEVCDPPGSSLLIELPLLQPLAPFLPPMPCKPHPRLTLEILHSCDPFWESVLSFCIKLNLKVVCKHHHSTEQGQILLLTHLEEEEVFHGSREIEGENVPGGREKMREQRQRNQASQR
jgi:hypothetical protein